MNDLVERCAGRIEMTADRISAETDDGALRRRALVLKWTPSPGVTAWFRADPLGAVVDVWGSRSSSASDARGCDALSDRLARRDREPDQSRPRHIEKDLISLAYFRSRTHQVFSSKVLYVSNASLKPT